MNPKNTRAFNNRGIAWSDKGETDKAIADYNEAIRLNPQNANAFFNRGKAWEGKRDFVKALADFKSYVSLAPNNSNGYEAIARVLKDMGRQEAIVNNNKKEGAANNEANNNSKSLEKPKQAAERQITQSNSNTQPLEIDVNNFCVVTWGGFTNNDNMTDQIRKAFLADKLDCDPSNPIWKTFSFLDANVNGTWYRGPSIILRVIKEGWLTQYWINSRNFPLEIKEKARVSDTQVVRNGEVYKIVYTKQDELRCVETEGLWVTKDSKTLKWFSSDLRIFSYSSACISYDSRGRLLPEAARRELKQIKDSFLLVNQNYQPNRSTLAEAKMFVIQNTSKPTAQPNAVSK